MTTKIAILICLLGAALALPTLNELKVKASVGDVELPIIIDDISGAGEDPIIDDVSGAGEDPIRSNYVNGIISDITGAGEDSIIDDVSGAGEDPIIDDISGAGEDRIIDDTNGAGEDPIIDDISGAGEDPIMSNYVNGIIDDITGAGEDPIIDDISGAGEDRIIDDTNGAGEDPIIDDVSGAGEDPIIDDVSGAGEDPIIDDVTGAGEDPIIDDISGAGEDSIIDDVTGAGEDPVIDHSFEADEDSDIDDSMEDDDAFDDEVDASEVEQIQNAETIILFENQETKDLFFNRIFAKLGITLLTLDEISEIIEVKVDSTGAEDSIIDDITGAGEDPIIDDTTGAGEDPIIDDTNGAGEDYYFAQRLNTIIDDISGAGEDPIIDDTTGAGEDPAIETPLFDARADVEFQLYTRSNAKTAQILKIDDLNSVRNSNFAASRPTRYIIHGWNNNGGSDVNRILRDAYLSKGDFNVICIDWGKGANNPVYTISRDRIRDVSTVGAAFIDFMANQAGQAVSNIQIVGHSLGGHTAGLIGKKVKAGKVPKIVGLDPASVGFSVGEVGERLDKGDASYVEVVHTSFLGMSSPIGHVDHYPNWGGGMPGCGTDLSGACSHGRAYEYFGESITSSRGFSATRCASYEEVSSKKCSSQGTSKFGGEPLNTGTTRGVYFFETNSNSPYAQ